MEWLWLNHGSYFDKLSTNGDFDGFVQKPVRPELVKGRGNHVG